MEVDLKTPKNEDKQSLTNKYLSYLLKAKKRLITIPLNQASQHLWTTISYGTNGIGSMMTIQNKTWYKI